MNRVWLVRAAARIGTRAGALAAAQGIARPNPFTGKAEDLARAWQDAYDRAVHPSAGRSGRQSAPASSSAARCTYSRTSSGTASLRK